MADNADRANDLAQWRLEQALKAHQSNPDLDSLERCNDCRVAIPKARQLAARGCTRCADCQAFFEKYGGRHVG